LFIGALVFALCFAQLGEFIFFVCPKKTEPKETAPGTPALQVPCATQKITAAAELTFFDTQSKKAQTFLAINAVIFFRCSTGFTGL